MVVFGWVLNKPLALLFDPFETVVRFHALLLLYQNFSQTDAKGAISVW